MNDRDDKRARAEIAIESILLDLEEAIERSIASMSIRATLPI